MMSIYQEVQSRLKESPRRWLVTGVAGFIGSHLLEALLSLRQEVIGFDNFSTGKQANLEEVRSVVGEELWESFEFVEGDTRDVKTCSRLLEKDVDYVLHQAALGSVPRSVADPISSCDNNISGFLNLITASQRSGVSRFVYASSSSVYGDYPGLPKSESNGVGRLLSPYSVTKYANELFSQSFSNVYDFNAIGLRYFNVFGPRQDPSGPYAAVIPKWIELMLRGESIQIHGDGLTSRDFCFVDNVVMANILAATAPKDVGENVFNIACGEKTTLNEVFQLLCEYLGQEGVVPEYCSFRKGDVRESLADISKAQGLLGYYPEVNFQEGLRRTVLCSKGFRIGS
jgi:UDP-N-acetylglucosamine 4-epimerase